MDDRLPLFNPLEIDIQIYQGPLQVLLDLIRQKRMDIYTVPLGSLCKSFLNYVHKVLDLNLDISGEFIKIASTLILLKSRTMLPNTADFSDEEKQLDPEESLRQKLIEYEEMKKVSHFINNRKLLFRDVFTRPVPEFDLKAPIPKFTIGPLSLLQAYKNVLEKVNGMQPLVIKRSNVNKDKIFEMIINNLKGREYFTFQDIFNICDSISEKIFAFLILLEMSKKQWISIEQREFLGLIHCQPLKEFNSSHYKEIL